MKKYKFQSCDKIDFTKNFLKFSFFFQNGEKDCFDGAILTMPVPQILGLSGIDSILTQDLKEKLSQVKYNSRYTFGLFYNDSNSFKEVFPESIVHCENSEIFEKFCLDSVKRGQNDSPASIVFLASKNFSDKYLDTDMSEVQDILGGEVYKNFIKKSKNWPAPNAYKCHRWRFSQVDHPFEGCPKAVVLNSDPPILAGGDAFVAQSANIGDCIASAYKMTELISMKMS